MKFLEFRGIKRSGPAFRLQRLQALGVRELCEFDERGAQFRACRCGICNDFLLL
jgi:hypothetical protein